MSSINAAYLIAHAAELRLVLVLLAVVASVATVSLILILEEAAKLARARFAQSGSGRLAAVGTHCASLAMKRNNPTENRSCSPCNLFGDKAIPAAKRRAFPVGALSRDAPSPSHKLTWLPSATLGSSVFEETPRHQTQLVSTSSSLLRASATARAMS